MSMSMSMSSLPPPATTLDSLLQLTHETLVYDATVAKVVDAKPRLSPQQQVARGEVPLLPEEPPPPQLLYASTVASGLTEGSTSTFRPGASLATTGNSSAGFADDEREAGFAGDDTFASRTAGPKKAGRNINIPKRQRGKRHRRSTNSTKGPRSSASGGGGGAGVDQVASPGFPGAQAGDGAGSTRARDRWQRAARKSVEMTRQGGGGGGIAGYSSRRLSQAVTEDQRTLAQGLVTQGSATLPVLMRDPLFVEAASKCGVELEELRHLPFSHFRTEPNSPIVRSKEAHELAFKLYEDGRVSKIAMILSQIEEIKQQRQADAERHRKLKDRVANAFWRTIQKEEDILSKTDVASGKVQRVLVEENSQIEESFAKFREAKQTFVERQLKIASDKERRTQALHELGKRKQVVIERYQERAEDLQAMRIARMQHKMAVKEVKLQMKLQRLKEEHAKKSIAKRQKVKDLKQRREAKERAAKAKERAARDFLSTKHAHIDVIKQRVQQEAASRQARRALLAQQKVARVARARQGLEYEHKLAAKRMAEWRNRIEQIDEIARAAAVQRQKARAEHIIRTHDFKKKNPVLRHIGPGPGTYDLRDEPPALPGSPAAANDSWAAAASQPARKPALSVRAGVEVHSRPMRSSQASRSSQRPRTPGGTLATRTSSTLRPNVVIQANESIDAILDGIDSPATTPTARGNTGGGGADGEAPAKPSDGGPQPAAMQDLFTPVKMGGEGAAARERLSRSTRPRRRRGSPKRGLRQQLTATAPAAHQRPKTTGGLQSSSDVAMPEGDLPEELSREAPKVPYARVRKVEALTAEDISQLSEEEYVAKISEARTILRQEGRHVAASGRPSYIDHTLRHGAELPGPGAHVLPKFQSSPVARWGTQNPKSDIEWQIYRAKQLPGPGEYANVQPLSHVTGARFGRHNPKSEFDVITARAAKIPGPADYNTSANQSTLSRPRSLQNLRRDLHL